MIQSKSEKPLNILIIDAAVYCLPNSKNKTKTVGLLSCFLSCNKIKASYLVLYLGGEVIIVFCKIYVHYITLLLSKLNFLKETFR